MPSHDDDLLKKLWLEPDKKESSPVKDDDLLSGLWLSDPPALSPQTANAASNDAGPLDALWLPEQPAEQPFTPIPQRSNQAKDNGAVPVGFASPEDQQAGSLQQNLPRIPEPSAQGSSTLPHDDEREAELRVNPYLARLEKEYGLPYAELKKYFAQHDLDLPVSPTDIHLPLPGESVSDISARQGIEAARGVAEEDSYGAPQFDKPLQMLEDLQAWQLPRYKRDQSVTPFHDRRSWGDYYAKKRGLTVNDVLWQPWKVITQGIAPDPYAPKPGKKPEVEQGESNAYTGTTLQDLPYIYSQATRNTLKFLGNNGRYGSDALKFLGNKLKDSFVGSLPEFRRFRGFIPTESTPLANIPDKVRDFAHAKGKADLLELDPENSGFSDLPVMDEGEAGVYNKMPEPPAASPAVPEDTGIDMSKLWLPSSEKGETKREPDVLEGLTAAFNEPDVELTDQQLSDLTENYADFVKKNDYGTPVKDAAFSFASGFNNNLADFLDGLGWAGHRFNQWFDMDGADPNVWQKMARFIRDKNRLGEGMISDAGTTANKTARSLGSMLPTIATIIASSGAAGAAMLPAEAYTAAPGTQILENALGTMMGSTGMTLADAGRTYTFARELGKGHKNAIDAADKTFVSNWLLNNLVYGLTGPKGALTAGRFSDNPLIQKLFRSQYWIQKPLWSPWRAGASLTGGRWPRTMIASWTALKPALRGGLGGMTRALGNAESTRAALETAGDGWKGYLDNLWNNSKFTNEKGENILWPAFLSGAIMDTALRLPEIGKQFKDAWNQDVRFFNQKANETAIKRGRMIDSLRADLKRDNAPYTVDVGRTDPDSNLFKWEKHRVPGGPSHEQIQRKIDRLNNPVLQILTDTKNFLFPYRSPIMDYFMRPRVKIQAPTRRQLLDIQNQEIEKRLADVMKIRNRVTSGSPLPERERNRLIDGLKYQKEQIDKAMAIRDSLQHDLKHPIRTFAKDFVNATKSAGSKVLRGAKDATGNQIDKFRVFWGLEEKDPGTPGIVPYGTYALSPNEKMVKDDAISFFENWDDYHAKPFGRKDIERYVNQPGISKRTQRELAYQIDDYFEQQAKKAVARESARSRDTIRRILKDDQYAQMIDDETLMQDLARAYQKTKTEVPDTSSLFDDALVVSRALDLPDLTIPGVLHTPSAPSVDQFAIPDILRVLKQKRHYDWLRKYWNGK